MKYLNPTRRCSATQPLHVALAAMVLLAPGVRGQQLLSASNGTSASNALPDAPSVVALHMAGAEHNDDIPLPPPCPPTVSGQGASIAAPSATQPVPCLNQNPLRIVVNSGERQPLTSGQKGFLAIKGVIDPVNLLVIAGEAGIGVAANSHSAYGPGFKGFGRLTGYDLLEDSQGAFFGVYLIPSLVHEDPRYRRMEHASVKRRIFHALERTVIAEHDDGRPMLNYATLLTYPISAELSNLYVPGIHGNGPSTTRRIVIGYATDPASNLIAEFLPDIARRIRVKSVFVQQIVNQMALGQGTGP